MPQESNSTDLFNQALAQLQQKNWDSAIELYHKILDQGPASLTSAQASVVYHNMSTAAAEKADVLMAYAWSKKSFYLNPANSAAREAFEHFSTQFQVPTIPHQISNFDNFRSGIAKVPLDLWLSFSVVMILLTLWLVTKKLILAKKNRLNDVFKGTSMWSVYILGIITLLLVAVSYFRINESSIDRGILIADKAQIQTAAGENKPVIFEAPAGLEVEVLNQDGDYYQIRSSGAFSGWIKKTQIELLSLTFGHQK